jgi:manganese efflux pump family protein
MVQLLLFLLPLGLDTLGVSVSLGMKMVDADPLQHVDPLSIWLRSALLFALAEMLMPLIGLAIGYAASLLVSEIMRFVGPLFLLGIGLWELSGEVREVVEKRRRYAHPTTFNVPPTAAMSSPSTTSWFRQLLLALSISMDELAVGFSLGTVTAKLAGGAFSPLAICILIGLQGFLMTIVGLALGRLLRTSVKSLKQWCEWLSALLLIGLGIWLLTMGG